MTGGGLTRRNHRGDCHTKDWLPRNRGYRRRLVWLLNLGEVNGLCIITWPAGRGEQEDAESQGDQECRRRPAEGQGRLRRRRACWWRRLGQGGAAPMAERGGCVKVCAEGRTDGAQGKAFPTARTTLRSNAVLAAARWASLHHQYPQGLQRLRVSLWSAKVNELSNAATTMRCDPTARWATDRQRRKRSRHGQAPRATL
jgi:hypothetical protein